jgi:hypothetical protein
MASEDLLKKAVAAFNALSPEQQAEMLEEQRQSWVRGNVGLSRDERGMNSPVMPRPTTVMASEYCKFPHCECSMGAAERCKRIRTRPAPADLKAGDRKHYKLIRKSLQNKGLLPADTDTGLETIGYGSPGSLQMVMDGQMDHASVTSTSGGVFTEPVCFRSQAEELLAAERARYVEASQRATNEESLKDTMHRGLLRWKERAEKAEAELAAERAEKKELDAECRVLAKRCIEKDARVKELEDERYKLAYAITGGEDAPGYLDSLSAETLVEVARKNTQHWFAETDRADKAETKLAACEKQLSKDRKLRNEAQCDADLWRFSVDMGDHPSLLVKVWKQRKALEAKLAAAEKALEPFATDADIYDDQDIEDGEKSFNDNITVGDLRKARAVLGGKPS